MKPGSRVWLALRRLRFLLTPASRRIGLKIAADGRHLTFILASLHRAGCAVRIFESPWLFREMISLSDAAPLPFVIGTGDPLPDELLITDDPACGRWFPAGRRILLDPDIFNSGKQHLPKMPYFIHPHVLHRGLERAEAPAGPRPVRIGFFGSHDPGFYESHFDFPILSRTPIIETLLDSFSSVIRHVEGPPSGWGAPRIAVAIDTAGGDRARKRFLAAGDYLAGLRSCDFFLSPPGWCMPVSHNLIEAMQCGAVPILNHPGSLEPSLRDGIDCLVFNDAEGLRQQLRAALEMPPERIARMRAAVLARYAADLEPGAWWKRCLNERPPVVLINNEEISVALRNRPQTGDAP